MPFQFIHAADLHLDTPFSGLQLTAPGLRQRLLDASIQAFDAIVARAIDRQVAFVVLAGDLYDGVERGPRAQRRFLTGLERLSTAGIEVFIAHGNHDPEGGRWSRIPSWPPGVHVFPSGTPIAFAVVRDGQTLAHVHGVSFGTRHEPDNLANRFASPKAAGFHVAVLHCNLDGDRAHEAYAPCELGDLQAKHFGYWALGHVHTHSVRRDGKTCVVYPGCSQGRNFNAAELGKKGAVEVTVTKDAVSKIEFFETDTVRFIDSALAVDALADGPALLDALMRQADAAATENVGRALVLRARLQGRSPLHRTLRRASDRDDVLRDLQGNAPSDVYWTALIDETRAPFDLDTLAEGSDLRAALISAHREWMRGAVPPQELVHELAKAKVGLCVEDRETRHSFMREDWEALSAAALEDVLEQLDTET